MIWNEERYKKAEAHTKLMEERYASEIQKSVSNTKVYTGAVEEIEYPRHMTNMLFTNTDTVSAAFLHNGGRTAILNFASFTSPGGGFIRGAMAQEEALCHESFLYNVLREKQDYYEENKKDLNSYLFSDRALYSKDVLFFKDNASLPFDVITCAAPNYGKAKEFVTYKENNNALRRRISFIRQIAEVNGVETLILGAYGCGVFQQDPGIVAAFMKSEFSVSSIETVIFAVPGQNKNFEIFWEVFG